MFDKFKADILFTQLLKRPDIEKAYAMVPPTDAWYDTITKVHNSLKEIQKHCRLLSSLQVNIFRLNLLALLKVIIYSNNALALFIHFHVYYNFFILCHFQV